MYAINISPITQSTSDGLLYIYTLLNPKSNHVPESEEGLLSEAGAGGGHGQHEGGDAEGGVDRHEAGAERGSRALAAEQQQEAEESHHELECESCSCVISSRVEVRIFYEKEEEETLTVRFGRNR